MHPTNGACASCNQPADVSAKLGQQQLSLCRACALRLVADVAGGLSQSAPDDVTVTRPEFAAMSTGQRRRALARQAKAKAFVDRQAARHPGAFRR